MRRTPLRRVGKIGRANIEANKRIRAMKPVQRCELQIHPDCKGKLFLTIAHRHKRAWYKGDPVKLSDKRQWLVACVNCHDHIEHKPSLTEELFLMVRGPENLSDK